jgi:hypothetical protein
MRLRTPKFRIALAAGLMASLFLALVLAAAPGSHHFIHKDAGTAKHECAVTLIGSGKYEITEAPVLVRLPQSPVRWAKLPSLHVVWVAAPFLGARIFEHAPPALS